MKLQFIVATLALVSSAVTWAEPTLYPKNLNVLGRITNNTNSNLVADEEDAHTVWVLPPNTAEASAGPLTGKTAGMGFCREMSDIVKYNADLTADMAEVMKQRKEAQGELNKKLELADKLNQEAESFATSANLMALIELDNRIIDAEARLSEIYKALETCTTDCRVISDEARELNSAKRDLLRDRRELARQHSADVRRYDRLKAQVAAAAGSYKNAKLAYKELEKELSDLKTQFTAIFDSYSKREGARTNLNYVSSWEVNITQLRADNPGINFSQMKTKNVLLTPAVKNSQLQAGESIIRLEIPGVIENDIVRYADYPASLTATTVLSLYGACPIEHPDYFDMEKNSATTFGLVITYDYETVFDVKATAVYNMYKMYQKIVASSSDGGLFSSRTSTSVEEKNVFQDSFVVEWDDRENTVSKEDRQQLSNDMHDSVMLRLATLALPNSPQTAGILPALQPGQHGAIVLAEGLTKMCGFNIYCQGGAIALNVLDAIFGSSSSTTSYTNIQDIEVRDSYKHAKKITKSWATSYIETI